MKAYKSVIGYYQKQCLRKLRKMYMASLNSLANSSDLATRKDFLAIIPARGGSKGIPRKNMRLLNGKPLISYVIETALDSSHIDSVAVTSDSDEILAYASQYKNVICVKRPSELADDVTTLDPVIENALKATELITGFTFSNVVTLQPTSPLLSKETLNSALEQFLASSYDSLISVVNEPHLTWKKDVEGNIVPGYIERLNRQQLPDNYLETGAFLISRRELITSVSRLGDKVEVFEVPIRESVDIDSYKDWVVCESILKRKKIIFRVDGYTELGLGHIYRALTLAYEFIEHDVVFICDASHKLGAELISSANMNIVEISNNEDLLNWLKSNKTDIFIYDCLDSETSLMRAIKDNVKRLISFEDLGDGARIADVVINALYEGDSPHTNTFTGKDYVVLRDEFLIAKPNNFSDHIEHVLVMFGGTDPLDLSYKVYSMAKKFRKANTSIVFDFILGAGYKGKLMESSDSGITISRDISRVSKIMKSANLAFSSQGRTTYELASMGVPTIVMAQNEREMLHRFAQMDNGFINLGLGSKVSDEDLLSTFMWIVDAVSVRREMHNLMVSNDLRSGIKRVKRLILGDE